MDQAILKSHVEKPKKFKGSDFRRWQQKMLFYLTSLHVSYVLMDSEPVEPYMVDGENVPTEAQMADFERPVVKQVEELKSLSMKWKLKAWDEKKDYTQQKNNNFKKVYNCWVCGKPWLKAEDCRHKKEHRGGNSGGNSNQANHVQFPKEFARVIESFLTTNVIDWWKKESHIKVASGKDLVLSNVLHVPNITKNLSFGPILSNNGFKLVTESDKFVITKGGVYVGKGYLDEGLFKLSVVIDDNVINNNNADGNSEVPQENVEPRRSKCAKVTKDFGPDYMMYIVNEEPQTYKAAMESSEAPYWKEAIQSKIDSIVHNNTRELADLPSGHKLIGHKWIFKKKLRPDGTIEKYKACLVATGYRQKECQDFFDTYSPVTRITSIRALIAIAAIHNLIIHQMDVMTAFLNGELDKEIYMKQPEGFVVKGQKHKIKERLKTTRSHQKSYADKRRKPLEFKVGDRGLLKECVGRVAYRLKLPHELSCIHDTFYVSNLKKCLAESDAQVPLEEIKIDENLRFVKEPIKIVERDVKKLKRRRIILVKVRWNSRQGAEYTWEREDQFKTKYPHLFAPTSSAVSS
nr:retrotransposon protein, putative, Ty1-copia subclass [Tanacetum cinerariifolium]